MDIRFDGKRALVTGAGKGIGRDLAKALHVGGAKTIAVARTQADLDSLKAECPGIETVSVDLSRWSEAKAAVEAMGPIDILVNNAGTNIEQPFLEVDEDTYDKIMAINLKTSFIVAQVVAKGMVERGNGGAIVNVSSVASLISLPNHVVYSLSKHALDGLTKTMALELGPHQIRTNAVNPTVVLTELGKYSWSKPEKAEPMLARIPLHKFAEIKDVVEPVLFLLSDRAAMVNGTILPIDGGTSVT